MTELLSRCPVCAARVYAETGTPTPPHPRDADVADGADEAGDAPRCPGTGQPSN